MATDCIDARSERPPKTRPQARTRKGRELEIVFVTVLAFGVFVWNSSTAPVSQFGPIEPRALLWLIRYELAAAVVIAVTLWLRGWRPSDFPFRVDAQALIAVIVILGAEYALRIGLWRVWLAFDLPLVGPSFERQSVDGALAWWEVSALALVNGAYEEILLLGYLCAAPMALKLRDAPRAMLILPLLLSLAIRLSYHGYQGPFGVTQLALVGLVMSGAFLWTRNLAPPVIAHVVFDAMALWQFVD